MRCRCSVAGARLARTGDYSACLIGVEGHSIVQPRKTVAEEGILDLQCLLPIPSRRKLRQGLAIVDQLLGAALEPEADNSTADLDHLERRLGGGQQQVPLRAIGYADADPILRRRRCSFNQA